MANTRRSGRRALTGLEVRVLSAASDRRCRMHAPTTVDAALRLAGAGASATEVAGRLAVPRSTVRGWLAGAVPHVPGPDEDGGCAADHRLGELPQEYVYLLGLYLGDGCISRSAKGVPKLRLSLDTK